MLIALAAPEKMRRAPAAHDYESALTSTVLMLFFRPFWGEFSWFASLNWGACINDMDQSRYQLGPISRGWLAVKNRAAEKSELSSIDYPRSSSRRVPLP